MFTVDSLPPEYQFTSLDGNLNILRDEKVKAGRNQRKLECEGLRRLRLEIRPGNK